MGKFIYLEDGDEIKETDEILHRGRWESLKDYSIQPGARWSSDGMKKMRREKTEQTTKRKAVLT